MEFFCESCGNRIGQDQIRRVATKTEGTKRMVLFMPPPRCSCNGNEMRLGTLETEIKVNMPAAGESVGALVSAPGSSSWTRNGMRQ